MIYQCIITFSQRNQTLRTLFWNKISDFHSKIFMLRIMNYMSFFQKDLRILKFTFNIYLQPVLPFQVDNIKFEKTHSYLDPIGRPTVVFEKKNVMKFHNQEFSLKYTFKHFNILIEPAILFGVYLAFFMMLIVAGRFQYKIEEKSKIE